MGADLQRVRAALVAGRLQAGDRGMWISDVNSYNAWVDCAAARKSLLAPTRPDQADPHPSDTEDPDIYLRADHSLDIADDCGNKPSPSPS